MEKSAVLSPCRRYRYELWRRWSNEPTCVFIGLNPSTADATQDDPTIRKCVGYAKRWGYGALCMVNLFAFRATKPSDMLVAEDPVGPENNITLGRLALNSARIIAAWGNHGRHLSRDARVMDMLPQLYCLKVNQDGSPAHPLYLPGSVVPFRYDRPEPVKG